MRKQTIMYRRNYWIIFVSILLVAFFCAVQTQAKKAAIKLVIGEYGCVTDADCPGGICLPTEKICLICEAPKVIEGTECVCPADMYEDETGCITCEAPEQIWNGRKCVCNEKNGYHLIEGVCETCPSDMPFWDGRQCVECQKNPDCADLEKPYCELSSHTCQPCPDHSPYWTGTFCGCATSANCTSVKKPYCHPEKHVCTYCPKGTKWSEKKQDCVCENDRMVLKNGQCTCDTENGWYNEVNGGCVRVDCVAHTEPFTAKSSLTFCTEHNRWIRIDTLENEIRVSFLDGWNGYHNYDWSLWGCRCTDYNTFNTTGSEGGHWTNATVHKIGYTDYNLKFPIYFQLSGVGCEQGTYTISSAGTWTSAGLCPGTGSTETNISYAIQTEIEGYKCPITGATCSVNNQCLGGEFTSNTEDICGLPGASENCNCPFGKQKIDGSCDWRCTNGRVIQEDGTCGCPSGMAFQNNWCRAACDESKGYTWDVTAQKCVCNNDTGFYANSSGSCVYCYGPTKRWNTETKTCDQVCMGQTYTVATAWYSAQYPTSRWNESTQSCECNADVFFYGTYPNCKRCQSTGTAYDESTGVCICDAEQGYPLSNGSCGLCLPGSKPNEEKNGCVCSGNNQVMYVKGECGSCDVGTKEIQVNNESACQLCMDARTRFYVQTTGKCTRCDVSETKSGVSKTACTACSNRIWLNDSRCALCSTGTITNIGEDQCRRCSQHFWTNNNTCYSCSISSTQTETSKTACTACANRIWLNNNSCALCSVSAIYENIEKDQCQRCNQHFWKSDKTCYPCSINDIQTDITKEECNRCSYLCWKETTPATKTSVALGMCGKCSILNSNNFGNSQESDESDKSDESEV